MSGDLLSVNADQYLQAAGENVAPPAIASDALVTGLTPTEQLLRVLGLAANADDLVDSADGIAEQAERDARAIQAAEEFTAQDQQAATDVNGVAAQSQTAQMAQQIPQMISGIAGAVAGALGGALQPLLQIPQQIAQTATQTGMGAYQASGESDIPIDDPGLLDTPLAEDLIADPGTFSDNETDGGVLGGGDIGGTGSTAGGFASTTPTGLLGPPPIPSAATAPASAPPVSVPPPIAPISAPPTAAGMAGVPMVPPGAMYGANAGDKDTKTDTKRVAVPPVRNGSPVEGRLTAPPLAPTVIKKVEGKPVATKRISTPDAENSQAPDPDYRS